jgi:predicted transcriptional regulator
MPLTSEQATVVEYCLKEEMTITEIGKEIDESSTMIRSHLKANNIPYHSNYKNRPDVLAGNPVVRTLDRAKYGLAPKATKVLLKDDVPSQEVTQEEGPKNLTFLENEGCRQETVIIEGEQRYCGHNTLPKIALLQSPWRGSSSENS